MTLSGLWTLDDLRRFDEARDARLRDLGWKSGKFVSLVDLRGHRVQLQAVTAQAQVNFRKPAIRPRRQAVLVSTMLNRLQAVRLASPVDERVFNDQASALTWLNEDRPAA